MLDIRQTWAPAEIAAGLGIGERAVHLRAGREGWQFTFLRTRGGRRKVYLLNSMPDDTRIALVNLRPAAEAGYRSGRVAVAEASAAGEAKRLAKAAGLAAYNGLPAAKQAVARARLAVLQARDGFVAASGLPKKRGSQTFCRELQAGSIPLPEGTLQAVANRKGVPAVSWASLTRWEKAYAEEGLAGLAPRYTATRETSIPKHMLDFIQAMKVDHPHAGVGKIIAGLSARFCGQEIPSRATVRRFVKKWEAENESLLLYISNPDAYKSQREFAPGNASEDVVRLNQLWEMDGTPTDVMLTDGRHTIIGNIDVFSRRAKVLVTPTAKAVSVAALIRDSILDWGVPECIKTDNGSDYVADHIDRVLEALEIRQHVLPPFSPEQKPHIERFFRTFSHDIVELLPGYVGHSVADRKAIEARRTFAQRMMRQGADPIEVNMTGEQFQEICDRWLAAVYHQNTHSSLDGRTPAQMVREWMGPIHRIRDERALDILLSPAPRDGGMRVIGKHGVQVDYGFYIAPEMAGHEGQSVLVLLDAADFGSVYVFLGDGQFLCRAVDADRAGIDRAEMADRVKAEQKRVMREGAKELKRVAREQKTRTIAAEILAHREAEIANILEMPRRSTDYTTDALDQAAMAVAGIRREEAGPQPIPISPAEEAAADAVIDLFARKPERPLPANDWERYEQLSADLRAGCALSDADLAWMKRYELRFEAGDMTDHG